MSVRMQKSKLVSETMKMEKKKESRREMQEQPGPAQASPRKVGVKKKLKEKSFGPPSFSARCTQQTSPYSLTKLQKERLNPFFVP